MAIGYNILKDGQVVNLNDFDIVCCSLSGEPVNEDKYSFLFEIFTRCSFQCFDKSIETDEQIIPLDSIVSKITELGYPQVYIHRTIKLHEMGYSLLAFQQNYLG